MEKIEIEKIKQIELDILKYITKFCDENNIKYYLAYGTLLGAIRHEGFIPWDDDIDISMPRPDYMRFIKLYDEKGSKSYKLCSIHSNEFSLFPFAKLHDLRTIKIEPIRQNDRNKQGIEIDIFPIDGLPKDEKLCNKHFQFQNRLHYFYLLTASKFSKGRTIIRTIVKFLVIKFFQIFYNPKRMCIKLNENAMKYDFEQSDYVANTVCCFYGKKEKIQKAYLNETIKVKFEGKYFNAPKDYNKYLTNLYGDYMTLPPEEKRKSHHIYEAYWKNK